jgi:hypothetical protein
MEKYLPDPARQFASTETDRFLRKTIRSSQDIVYKIAERQEKHKLAVITHPLAKACGL